MKHLIFLLALLCGAAAAQTTINYARMLSGVVQQTCGPYTFQASDVTTIVAFNCSGNASATLPGGALTAGFGKGSIFAVQNNGAGSLTITCSSCTINGASTLLVNGLSGATLYGDGTNFVAQLGATGTSFQLSNPQIFPGGAVFNGAVSINPGLAALGLIPDSLCVFAVLQPQDQICNLNGQLVINSQGAGGVNDWIMTANYRDMIGNPPAGGSMWFFNSVIGKLQEFQPPVAAPNNVPLTPTITPQATGTIAGFAPVKRVTNAQTGTTYTILATDRGGYLSFSNAAAIAVTLPQAGTAGFDQNFFIDRACAIGAGTATITPTTSTISYTNGQSYTAAASSMALATGQCASLFTDNTNYFAVLWNAAGVVGNCPTVGGIAFYNVTGTTVTCPQSGAPALTYAPSAAGLADTQGTLTSTFLWLNHQVTFNAGATAFQNFIDNISCTAAAAGTKHFELQIAGADVVALLYSAANCASAQWQIPAGSVTLPGLIFGTNTGGLYSRANNIFGFTNGTNGSIEFQQGGPRLQSGGAYEITNNSNVAAGTTDICWDRAASGVARFDTDTSCSNGQGFVSSNQGFGPRLTATAALTAGQPVKADTANANQVVVTVTTDTGAGIVIGVVVNSPGVGGTANIINTGIEPMILGTGTCSIGNFVIVDTTTNGRVKCTATYAAGTVIGVALAAQSTVGSSFNVMVGLR